MNKKNAEKWAEMKDYVGGMRKKGKKMRKNVIKCGKVRKRLKSVELLWESVKKRRKSRNTR